MFSKKELDIVSLRKDAQLNGLFESKRGITIFYTTYLGLDIDEALPKIQKECMCRDIPFDAPIITEADIPKNAFQKMDDAMGSINSMAEKYPIVKDAVMPMIGQILAGGATALLGVITGKKIEQGRDNDDASDGFDLNKLEVADITQLKEVSHEGINEDIPNDN